jgi:predicted Zn-dependent peptidase
MRQLLLLLLSGLCGVAFGVAPISHTLANGLHLVLVSSAVSPMVSVELLLNASACDERFPTPAPRTPWVRAPGLRKVLLGSMMQGSPTLDAATIRRTMTASGGILEARVQPDTLELSMTLPATALATGLNALAEIVCHPRLTDADIQASIAQAKADINAEPSGVVNLADALSRHTLFLDHPYATAGEGMHGCCS